MPRQKEPKRKPTCSHNVRLAVEKRILFPVLCFVLLVVFFPVFFLDFGVHNDYSVAAYDNHTCCKSYPETEHLVWIGRPLGAVLLNLHFFFLSHDFNQFKFARLASFVVFLVLFWGVSRQFSREAADVTLSTLTAFSILLLPASILYVFWLTNLVPGTFNLLLATLAFSLVARSHSAYGRQKMLFLLFGSCCVAATFLIYPPTAYFFLVFPAWRALMTDKLALPEWRRRTAVEFGVVAAITGGYGMAIKLMNTTGFVHLFFKSPHAKPAGGYAIAVVPHASMLAQHVSGYVTSTFQTWFEGWSPVVSPVASGILALYICWALLTLLQHRASSWMLVWSRFAIPTLAVGFAAAPMVLSNGGMLPTRALFVGEAIVALTFQFGLSRLMERLPFQFTQYNPKYVVAISLSAVAALAAVVRVSTASYNAFLELKYLRKEIEQVQSPKSLIVRLPPPASTIVGFPIVGDFQLMGSNFWPIDGLFYGVLKEKYKDTNALPSIVFLPYSCSIYTKGIPAITMVNGGFNVPEQALPQVASSKKQRIVLTPGDQLQIARGVISAFDKCAVAGAQFWETPYTTPLAVTLDFGGEDVAKDYLVSSGGELPERMPTEWKLFAASNKNQWSLLDAQTQVNWEVNSQKVFTLKIQKPFRFYRLVFSKTNSPFFRLYHFDLEFKAR